MGWYDGHLHAFLIDGEEYQGAPPFEDGIDPYTDALDEAEYRLCDLLPGAKTKFLYTYDFGDDWEHSILVEKVIPAEDKPRVMVCLAGRGRCPKEDSGGLWGYYDKLAILADPNHPEHEEVKDWMGEIDPEEFDAEEVTRALQELKA
jgi:Plasmid pRiA4b ORF-3-like protein